MSITLTVSATTVTLHPDLYWIDENSWHPVEQRKEYSVTGALIVQAAARQAGRPITLQPIDESSAWMTLATVVQLRNWAAVAGQIMQLTLRGVTRNVMFRHEDTALEATPVVHFNTVDNADLYQVTIRLMEV